MSEGLRNPESLRTLNLMGTHLVSTRASTDEMLTVRRGKEKGYGWMYGGKRRKEKDREGMNLKEPCSQFSASAAHFSQHAADSGSTSGTVLVQEQPAQLSQLWSLQGSRHSETTAGTFVGECNRCSFVQLLF